MLTIGVKRVAVAVLFIGASIATYSQSNSDRVILQGHVYDDAGNAVSGATVDLLPLEAAWTGPRALPRSDEQGYFHQVVPVLGKTRVSASKISAGYPDTTGKLFSSSNDAAMIVELSGSQPVDVDIHLGPPDGRIDGRVVDKNSGNIIRSARILLRWADDLSVMYSGNISPDGTFQYALPQHPIVLTITAPGFKRWVYTNEETGDRFLNIPSGEHLPIRAELEPIQTP